MVSYWRYSCFLIHGKDRGREFSGDVITTLRNEYGISRKPIASQNPQAKAMVECCHQTFQNMIRTQQLHVQQDLNFKGALAAAIAAATYHQAEGAVRARYHGCLHLWRI